MLRVVLIFDELWQVASFAELPEFLCFAPVAIPESLLNGYSL